MDVEIECLGAEQDFKIKVVGVTFPNPDGSDRQAFIKRCRSGEPIRLVREYDNPHDPMAVAVFRAKGQQLGYLPRGDRLAHHLDSGGGVRASVFRRMGGSGFLGLLFPQLRKPYALVLNITKTNPDWNAVQPYMDADKKIEKLLASAKSDEKRAVERAITKYRKAIEFIHELDGAGILGKAWRRARYPINRLSLLLEKSKRFDESLEAIRQYESYDDYCGILTADAESVAKRQSRLTGKTSA